MVDRYPPFPTITHLLAILTGPSGVSRNFDPLRGKNPQGTQESENGVVGKGSSVRGGRKPGFVRGDDTRRRGVAIFYGERAAFRPP